MILNVGPNAKELLQVSILHLREIGCWMKSNREEASICKRSSVESAKTGIIGNMLLREREGRRE